MKLGRALVPLEVGEASYQAGAHSLRRSCPAVPLPRRRREAIKRIAARQKLPCGFWAAVVGHRLVEANRVVTDLAFETVAALAIARWIPSISTNGKVNPAGADELDYLSPVAPFRSTWWLTGDPQQKAARSRSRSVKQRSHSRPTRRCAVSRSRCQRLHDRKGSSRMFGLTIWSIRRIQRFVRARPREVVLNASAGPSRNSRGLSYRRRAALAAHQPRRPGRQMAYTPCAAGVPECGRDGHGESRALQESSRDRSFPRHRCCVDAWRRSVQR